MRLVPLVGFAALAACVPPAPLSVSGAWPSPGATFAVIGDDAVTLAAKPAIMDLLTKRGYRLAPDRPERLVNVTLADRPRISGSFAGDRPPQSRRADGWADAPQKGGWFGKGRREIRLSVRFLSSQGKLLEERVATEVVKRSAPPADVARLAAAALR